MSDEKITKSEKEIGYALDMLATAFNNWLVKAVGSEQAPNWVQLRNFVQIWAETELGVSSKIPKELFEKKKC